METYTLKTIARYRGELSGKFGLPRQAGSVEAREGRSRKITYKRRMKERRDEEWKRAGFRNS